MPEWVLVEPLIPPARHGGRRRSVKLRGAERDFLHPVQGVPVEGAAEGPAAKDHGARLSRTVGTGTARWSASIHTLYVAVREQQGREASPTVAVIDSQTAKAAQKGGLGSILRATMRTRRSRVASGTSWSTRWALVKRRCSTPPMFRTVMERFNSTIASGTTTLPIQRAHLC